MSQVCGITWRTGQVVSQVSEIVKGGEVVSQGFRGVCHSYMLRFFFALQRANARRDDTKMCGWCNSKCLLTMQMRNIYKEKTCCEQYLSSRTTVDRW